MLRTELPEHSEQQLAKLPRELAALVNARVRVRRGAEPGDGKCVVYWMQRAERAVDNPALDLAVNIGNALGLPVVAFFSAIDNFPNANLRHYRFLQQGLADVEHDLAERGIGFCLRRPPDHEPAAFLEEVQAAVVIGDENPLRFMRAKRDALARKIAVPFPRVCWRRRSTRPMLRGPGWISSARSGCNLARTQSRITSGSVRAASPAIPPNSTSPTDGASLTAALGQSKATPAERTLQRSGSTGS
jgi:hypothetical protein